MLDTCEMEMWLGKLVSQNCHGIFEVVYYQMTHKLEVSLMVCAQLSFFFCIGNIRKYKETESLLNNSPLKITVFLLAP